MFIQAMLQFGDKAPAAKKYLVENDRSKTCSLAGALRFRSEGVPGSDFGRGTEIVAPIFGRKMEMAGARRSGTKR